MDEILNEVLYEIKQLRSDTMTIGKISLEVEQTNVQCLADIIGYNSCSCIMLTKLKDVLIDLSIHNHYLMNPKYNDPKHLRKYEYQLFSQNGEDGIINEIFKRIGTTNKYFVEFGVGDGLENNTLSLLYDNWQGAWIEADNNGYNNIQNKFQNFINNGKLTIKNSFIDASNIQDLFKQMNVPNNLDLLSIDIDGNDYWVWKAITDYSPRVVIAEYNGSFGPSINWIMKYNPSHVWNKTNYLGASLKAFELLGKQKGYKLVGTDFTGLNAFFVREDLVEDKFLEPYTSENHFEKVKYYYTRRVGHNRDVGEFEQHID